MWRMDMKRFVIVLLVVLCFIVGTGIGTGFYLYNNILNVDTIYSGIKIDGYYVGDKTKKDALEYLELSKMSETEKRDMNLVYEDKVYRISLEDIGFKYEYESAVNIAYNQGRTGSFFDKLKDIKKIKDNGMDIPLESHYEKEKINTIVADIAQEMNKEPVEAIFKFNGGNIKIEEEVMGRELQENKLINEINENIYILEDIDMEFDEIQPKLTKQALSRINGVIGEYSTSFRGSTLDRIENIKLSARSLSGKMLLPGEDLSYNNTTGPRESKFGYKEANVIFEGELTPGVGGGVCQTSTTMYNALLLSNLTILERHPHSLPPAYVKYGQDAAVAYGYLDLKFRNDFDYPIYIDTKTTNERVYIYIYGDLKAKDYTIKIEPEIIETIEGQVEEIYDGNLQPGEKVDIQKGRTGYKVKTYKSLIKNGQIVNKSEITHDYYRQRDHIYKVGPKALEYPEYIDEDLDMEEFENEEDDEN